MSGGIEGLTPKAPTGTEAPSGGQSEDLVVHTSGGTEGTESEQINAGTTQETFWQQYQKEIMIGGIAGILLLAVIAVLVILNRKRISSFFSGNSGKKGKDMTMEAGKEDGSLRVGKVHEQGARSSQQDCFFVSPEEMAGEYGLLAVVADGMGGLKDGDKVSQTAVTAIMNGFFRTGGEPEQVLLGLLTQANRAVNNLLGREGISKSGSTMVMGLIRGGAFHYVSVGDSRICLYRDGVLYQLNREHVFRNELMLRVVNDETTLQEAVSHPKGAGLSSFLGMGRLKFVDIPAQPVPIRPGDRFVLMSDGVYNALSEEEMTAALKHEAPEAAEMLNAAIRAKAYSNQDNYTAIIVQC